MPRTRRGNLGRQQAPCGLAPRSSCEPRQPVRVTSAVGGRFRPPGDSPRKLDRSSRGRNPAREKKNRLRQVRPAGGAGAGEPIRPSCHRACVLGISPRISFGISPVELVARSAGADSLRESGFRGALRKKRGVGAGAGDYGTLQNASSSTIRFGQEETRAHQAASCRTTTPLAP